MYPERSVTHLSDADATKWDRGRVCVSDRMVHGEADAYASQPGIFESHCSTNFTPGHSCEYIVRPRSISANVSVGFISASMGMDERLERVLVACVTEYGWSSSSSSLARDGGSLYPPYSWGGASGDGDADADGARGTGGIGCEADAEACA